MRGLLPPPSPPPPPKKASHQWCPKNNVETELIFRALGLEKDSDPEARTTEFRAMWHPQKFWIGLKIQVELGREEASRRHSNNTDLGNETNDRGLHLSFTSSFTLSIVYWNLAKIRSLCSFKATLFLMGMFSGRTADLS